jgi:hypothetical protein
MPKKPRRKYPSVIHDEQIAGGKQVGQRGHQGMSDLAGLPPKIQESCVASTRSRLLRYQLGGKLEIEVGDVHLNDVIEGTKGASKLITQLSP